MNYLAQTKAWLRLEVKKWFLGGLKLELDEGVGIRRGEGGVNCQVSTTYL